jgi:hypothetical protein
LKRGGSSPLPDSTPQLTTALGWVLPAGALSDVGVALIGMNGAGLRGRTRLGFGGGGGGWTTCGSGSGGGSGSGSGYRASVFNGPGAIDMML